MGWRGVPSKEEEVWEEGVLAGRGVALGAPAVRAAEATGPTAAAQGHGEVHSGVHAGRATGQLDGADLHLAVGAHGLWHRWQGGWQHPNLEASRGEKWGSARH